MTGSWDKFKLLMWKNWTLQKRHKIKTVIEILCPIIFMMLLVMIRSLVEPKNEPIQEYDKFKASFWSLLRNQTLGDCEKIDRSIKISYSPQNDKVEELISKSMFYLLRENIPPQDSNCAFNISGFEDNPIVQLVGYKDAKALDSQLIDPLLNDSSLCGIQFEDELKDLKDINQWPNNSILTLRFPAQLRNVPRRIVFLNWRTDLSFPVFQFPGPRGSNEQYGGWPSYVQEGFSPIAHSLIHEITNILTKNAAQPAVWISRFPYPEYLNDGLIPVMKIFISTFVILAFCYPCINIIRTIALEKEKQLKEVMKIMGLPNSLHWLAWFLKSFIFLMISIVIIIIILKVEWYKSENGLSGYSLFTNTPWHFLLFFFVIYIITSITYFFLISTMFSKANTAAAVGGLIWFLSNIPYTFLNSDEYIPSLATRLLCSLVSNTAMSFGFEIILSHESTSEGLQWSNIFTPLTDEDPLVMGHILLMFIVDAILYLLLALYIEQVFPGEYGIPQRWYFPFTKKFWSGFCGCSKIDEDDSFDECQNNDIQGIEPEPKNLKVGVKIMNLTKVFKDKTAVDKLNLKIFENQITVLLGHNGAGKTTTMSMLTGVLPPTSGTAKISGFDIRTNILEVRDSLGLCPQHNVLFNDLTVAEHIYFFSRLKGFAGIALEDEIDKYVKSLGLENKRDELSSSLSGGMKRRLSVGTALCGGSRVVMLDEPTSGMDPSARRELWDLLALERKGRTMILTTHFMDEAEILGERIAILSKGKLRCVGSPFYLKKKFGMGYRLTATRQASSNNTLTPSATPITNILLKYISNIKVYTDIGSEISYILPEERTSVFPTMLEELENNQKELGISGFGITASNLEDVFMRVGADLGNFQDDEASNSNNYAQSNEYINELGSPSAFSGRYSGTKLRINQWKAMFMKKGLVAIRSWMLHLLQLFIPVMFISLGIFASRMFSDPAELPERVLELKNGYSDSSTFLHAIDNNSRAVPYREYFEKENIDSMKLIDINGDMTAFYLNKTREDIPLARKKYLIGATLEERNTTAWFSNFGHHELPASLMLVQNSILQTVVPDSKITLVNRPLPFTLESEFSFIAYGNGSANQIATNLSLCMAFVSAFFIMFYIKENISRSKLLQLASGASPLTLWLASFIWDMIWIFFIAGATCVTILVFQEDGVKEFGDIARVFLIILIFGWAELPICYFASSIFKSPSSGFSRMVLINVFSGMATFITVEVLKTPDLDLQSTGNILHYIFLIFPHYAVASGTQNLIVSSMILDKCNKACERTINCTLESLCLLEETCCISNYPYFEWNKQGIGAHITYMLIIGFLFMLIVIAREYKVHDLIWRPSHAPPTPISPSEEDSDVAAERDKIISVPYTDYTKYNLLCQELSKYYHNFLAVDQLTFGVQDGECFGLLGINGAGKTTTFKMLTGDLLPSSGEAWIKGYSVNTNIKQVHQNIGYCPQFDALLEEMTGRETLRMYSLLRGIPKWRQEQYVLNLSKKLGFTKHLDKKVGEYSGGNKRKLSTSIALLGDPQVVYLDEPTTGMDPAAKRLVWNAISECNCVILTSHSMEECEALCTRLAIMVNGRPQCLGSPQHLKNKFSQGYTLIVKMKMIDNQIDYSNSNIDEQKTKLYDFDMLHKFLVSKFSNVQILETYQGIITYRLLDPSILWSKIFGIMESSKNELNIEDYSIGQTTLEQIFLQFTKHQVVSEVNIN